MNKTAIKRKHIFTADDTQKVLTAKMRIIESTQVKTLDCMEINSEIVKLNYKNASKAVEKCTLSTFNGYLERRQFIYFS